MLFATISQPDRSNINLNPRMLDGDAKSPHLKWVKSSNLPRECDRHSHNSTKPKEKIRTRNRYTLMNRQTLLEEYARGRRDFSGENLAQIDLSGCNLTSIDLREANLHQANLAGAILSPANLQHANLQETCLRHANLNQADLERANLTDAVLSAADLREGKLRGASLVRARFIGADLRGAILQDAVLQDPNFLHATMPDGRFYTGCVSDIALIQTLFPQIF